MKTIYIVTPGLQHNWAFISYDTQFNNFLIRFFLNKIKINIEKRKESCIQLWNFITTNKQENIKKNKKVYKTIYNKKGEKKK